VLIWINLLFRSDIGLIAKLTWAVVSIIPFVPFVYVLTGNDFIYVGNPQFATRRAASKSRPEARAVSLPPSRSVRPENRPTPTRLIHPPTSATDCRYGVRTGSALRRRGLAGGAGW
jgi:hypothetical protein